MTTDNHRRLYERPLARAHALADEWDGDPRPITRTEAARLLAEAINPDGWTETTAPPLVAVPPEAP